VGNTVDEPLGRVKMQTALDSARNSTLPILMVSQTNLEQLISIARSPKSSTAVITRQGVYEASTLGVAAELEIFVGTEHSGKLPVYLWPRQSKLGKRSYIILKDSLLLHPKVQMVPSHEQAQLIVWHTVGEDIKSPVAASAAVFAKLSKTVGKEEAAAAEASLKRRLVVADYSDAQQLHQDVVAGHEKPTSNDSGSTGSVEVDSSGRQDAAEGVGNAHRSGGGGSGGVGIDYVAYFKRSWVDRRSGVSLGRVEHQNTPQPSPLAYCVAHQFLVQTASATAACKQVVATYDEAFVEAQAPPARASAATVGSASSSEEAEEEPGRRAAGRGAAGGGGAGGEAAVAEWLKGRDLLLSCTLRTDGTSPLLQVNGTSPDTAGVGAGNWGTSSARSRVLEWAAEAARKLGLSVVDQLEGSSVGSAGGGGSGGCGGSGGRGTVLIGQASHKSRGSIDAEYFSVLRRSRVVLTANPRDWEGDWRLWEALASGALVLVDRMFTLTRMGEAGDARQWGLQRQWEQQQRQWEQQQPPPLPQPFLHGTHLIVYDSTDHKGFMRLITQVLMAVADREFTATTTSAEATTATMATMATMACTGHLHALRHHTCVHRVDGLLRSARERQQRQQQQQQQQQQQGG
jgi:hypothetical protein